MLFHCMRTKPTADAHSLKDLRKAAEAFFPDDPSTAKVTCPLYSRTPYESAIQPDHYILFCRTKDSVPSDESHGKTHTSPGDVDAATKDAEAEASVVTVPAQKPGLAHLLKTLTQGGQYPVIRAHLDADELDPSAAVSTSQPSQLGSPSVIRQDGS